MKVSKRKFPKKDVIPKNIKEFFDDIEKLEGAVSYSVLKPKGDFPYIILLGDIHNGRNGCEKDCVKTEKCYSLYQKPNISEISFISYLSEQSKNKNIMIDFFTEYWIPLKERLACTHFLPNKDVKKQRYIDITDEIRGCHNSAMGDIIFNTVNCISKENKSCIYDRSNLKFHMSDLRKDKDEKYFIEGFINVIQRTFELDDKNEILHSLDNSFTYLMDRISEDFKDEDFDFIERMFENNFSLSSYLKEPIVKKYSKIYHEIIQLPENIRQDIINISDEIIKNMVFDEFNFSFNFLIPTMDIFEYEKYLKRNVIKYIKKRLFDILCLFVDIYTICRILKTPKGGKKSDISVIYLGADHIISINGILNDTMLYETLKSENLTRYMFGKNIDKVEKCLLFNNKNKLY